MVSTFRSSVHAECLREERQVRSRRVFDRCLNPVATAEECSVEHEAYTVRRTKCRATYFRGCPTTNYFPNREECARDCEGRDIVDPLQFGRGQDKRRRRKKREAATHHVDVRCGFPAAWDANEVYAKAREAAAAKGARRTPPRAVGNVVVAAAGEVDSCRNTDD